MKLLGSFLLLSSRRLLTRDQNTTQEAGKSFKLLQCRRDPVSTSNRQRVHIRVLKIILKVEHHEVIYVLKTRITNIRIKCQSSQVKRMLSSITKCLPGKSTRQQASSTKSGRLRPEESILESSIAILI